MKICIVLCRALYVFYKVFCCFFGSRWGLVVSLAYFVYLRYVLLCCWLNRNSLRGRFKAAIFPHSPGNGQLIFPKTALFVDCLNQCNGWEHLSATSFHQLSSLLLTWWCSFPFASLLKRQVAIAAAEVVVCIHLRLIVCRLFCPAKKKKKKSVFTLYLPVGSRSLLSKNFSLSLFHLGWLFLSKAGGAMPFWVINFTADTSTLQLKPTWE